ncbi:MAG: hypothetical protein QXQ31_08030 [Zestosphaera sp.]
MEVSHLELKGLISVVQATGESVAISSERVEGFLLILPFRIAKVLKNRRVVAKADRFGRSPLAVLLYHFCSSRTSDFTSILRKDEDSYYEDTRIIPRGY